MKLLIGAVLVVGALGGCVFGVGIAAFIFGLFCPREHVNTASKTVPSTPADNWRKITAYEAAPTWQPWVANVEKLEGDDMLGSRWRWTETNGDTLHLRVTAWEPERRVVTATDDPSLPFSGTWEIVLVPQGQGTEVTVTERGVVPNPVMRTLWRLFRPAKGTVERYVEAL